MYLCVLGYWYHGCAAQLLAAAGLLVVHMFTIGLLAAPLAVCCAFLCLSECLCGGVVDVFRCLARGSRSDTVVAMRAGGGEGVRGARERGRGHRRVGLVPRWTVGFFSNYKKTTTLVGDEGNAHAVVRW